MRRGEKNFNLSIRIYVIKLENRFTFKIKTRSYLELLTPETIKLLGCTKSKITKDENDENVSNLENNEVLLVNYNIVNNDYQQDWGVLWTFNPNKCLSQLLEFLLKIFYF